MTSRARCVAVAPASFPGRGWPCRSTRSSLRTANSGDDRIDGTLHRRRDVDADRLRRRLAGGELAVEKGRGHVTVLARREPGRDQLAVAFQEDHLRVGNAG